MRPPGRGGLPDPCGLWLWRRRAASGPRRLCVRWGRSSCCDRVEVESPVGARVECLLQAAAGGEPEGEGGFVGECAGVAGGVELGGDAAAREDRVPGELPGTGAGPFVAARPGLV